jgi:hypothetical protein
MRRGVFRLHEPIGAVAVNRRGGKLARLLLVIALPVVVLAFMPGRAGAATITVNPTFSGSGGNTSILSALAVCDECAPDAFFSDPNGFINTWGLGLAGEIQAQASWTNPSSIDLNYTPGLIRHGQTVDLSDVLTPGTGTITLNYSVSGTIGVFGSHSTGSLSCAAVAVSNASCNGWLPTTDTLDIGPITDSDTIPCQMPLPGDSPRDCSKQKTIQLWSADLFSLASAEIDLVLDETVHVTDTGVSSVRIAVVSGGNAIPNNTLTFGGSSPSTVSDPIDISCSQPAGNDLIYTLSSPNTTAEPATYSGDVHVKLSASILGFGGGSYDTGPLVSSSGADLGPIALSAPDQQVDLGPVLKNNLPPVASAGGPYAGVEGTPVNFDAGGSTSACGLSNLTFAWHFSDGGVAFGQQPQHTFRSPGVFSGELTATDADGNVGVADFSVTIGNLAPVANAGPDMSTEWGLPITLAGSAVDPGADEQPFLNYKWSFGDGTPSASGGPSAVHTYAAPGNYTATLTSCDPESACGTSTMHVVVVQRTTTVTYTGPNKSQPSKNVTLSASLVDDQSQAVAGKLITFTLGTQTITATTNSSGVASATIKLNQKQNSYTVTAAFAGDTKYVGNTQSGTFQIGP